MASLQLTVTTNADTGVGSLRSAIDTAEAAFDADLDFAAGDFVDIVFDSSLNGDEIILGNELTFNGNTDIRINGDIDGDGSGDITISGDTNGNGVADVGDTGLIRTTYDSELSLSNLTLTNGFVDSSNDFGYYGYITSAVALYGDTQLTNVVISDTTVIGQNYYESSQLDAATVSNQGLLRLTDVVFENNSVTGGDGSIDFGGYTDEGGRATSGIHNTGDIVLSSATFDGDATGGAGGYDEDGGDAGVGIYNASGGNVDAGGSYYASGLYGVGGELDISGGAGGESASNGSTDSGLFGNGTFNGGEGFGAFEQANFGTSGDDIEDLSLTLGGTFLGLQGDDEITGAEGVNLFGGAGDDLLIMTGGAGGENPSLVLGGDGDDTVIVDGTGNAAFGGGGEGNGDLGVDTLSFENIDEGVTVDLNLTIQEFVAGQTIFQAQFENLNGTSFADVLQSGDLDAGGVVKGFGGADVITAGAQGSELYGGAGADELIGSEVADILSGGNGVDMIAGSTGNDELFGGDGNDALNGGDGRDELFGNDGQDTLNGNSGNDIITGNSGSDDLNGNRGADDLNGNRGADVLNGGRGRDNVTGGRGQDEIAGGLGDDILTGGQGADTFIFSEGFEVDTITDFSTSDGDMILLTGDLFTGNMSAQDIVDEFGSTKDGSAALRFGDGDTLVFEGLNNASQLVDFIDFA